MKKSIFLLRSLCAISTALAQNATTWGEKATTNVIMKKSTFWSTFETEGKTYSNGT